ncbi:MAG: membrane protein insertase YidC [Candidatus Niyogibacteria bacterium]|nr:MAG: membrane protein insertase YidC [Candidatus Niyogibacteria bacterium]
MAWLLVIFNEIFYRPLLNALVWLTGFLPFNDLGLAVIVLTVVVRIVLFPLTHRSIKTQNKMKQIEPELKKIKDNFKDRQEQARRTMELYRAHGINPLSGILLLFLQLPILIALYLVFRESVNIDAAYLYGFIAVPEHVNTMFLGLFDLSQGSMILAAAAALSQFMQIKLAKLPSIARSSSPGAKSMDFGKMMSWQMTYFMPLLIFFIAMRFPSAVSLYWTTLNIFATVHEGIVRKKAQKIYAVEGNSSKDTNSDSKPS